MTAELRGRRSTEAELKGEKGGNRVAHRDGVGDVLGWFEDVRWRGSTTEAAVAEDDEAARSTRWRDSGLEVVDEEEAADDGASPGAFLDSGEVSGRDNDDGHGVVVSGVCLLRSERAKERGNGARVMSRGSGVTLSMEGKPRDGCHRGHGAVDGRHAFPRLL